MNDNRPLILCSNDDGYFARGLLASVDALSKFARVVVVAPETEQSATSHSLTLHRPLRLRQIDVDRYALDGTPADCIYLALHVGETGDEAHRILPRRPDLVVSGINRGTNLGQDVFYSGTVAAAREGALRGIPAIAVSAQTKTDNVTGNTTLDTTHAANLIERMVHLLFGPLKACLANPFLLNVNVPSGDVRGLALTRLGTRLWQESVEVRQDPRGRTYYWVGGYGVKNSQESGTDTAAFDAGYATITPLRLDLSVDGPALDVANHLTTHLQ